jgi:hypothetical protein
MSPLGRANEIPATAALIEMAMRSVDGAYKPMRDAGSFPRDRKFDIGRLGALAR